MTESERVARELLAYRDNPPVRQAGLVEGQWYESGDILWIIMAPRCEFTTYELLTRLAELMGRGTCKMEATLTNPFETRIDEYHCSECGEYCSVEKVMGKTEPPKFCPECGRRVEE